MALVKKEVVQLYRKRAKHYNFTANLYTLSGSGNGNTGNGR